VIAPHSVQINIFYAVDMYSWLSVCKDVTRSEESTCRRSTRSRVGFTSLTYLLTYLLLDITCLHFSLIVVTFDCFVFLLLAIISHWIALDRI